MKLVVLQGLGIDSWGAAARASGVDAVTYKFSAAAFHSIDWPQVDDAIVLIDGPIAEPKLLPKVQERARGVVLRVTGQRPTQSVLKAASGIITPLPHLARTLIKEGLAAIEVPVAFDPRHAGLGIDSTSPDGAGVPAWTDRALTVAAVGPWHEDAHAFVACAGRIPQFRYYGPVSDDMPDVLRMKRGAPVEPYAEILSQSRFVVDCHGPHAGAPRGDGKGSKWYTANQVAVDAAGLGAVLVTEESVNLARYLKPWKECVPYGNPREAALYTESELHNPEHAAGIAEAGMARVWSEHLITHRIARVLEFAEGVAR